MLIVHKKHQFSMDRNVSLALKTKFIELSTNFVNHVKMVKFLMKIKINAFAQKLLHFGMDLVVLLAIIHNISILQIKSARVVQRIKYIILLKKLVLIAQLPIHILMETNVLNALKTLISMMSKKSAFPAL